VDEAINFSKMVRYANDVNFSNTVIRADDIINFSKTVRYLDDVIDFFYSLQKVSCFPDILSKV
jgi:hypothetical protein